VGQEVYVVSGMGFGVFLPSLNVSVCMHPEYGRLDACFRRHDIHKIVRDTAPE